MTYPPESFTHHCKTLGYELSGDEILQMGRYIHLLLETNKQFNLTAIKDPDEAWMRHVLDSLSLLPFIGEVASVIDVGSGGGLPGIPMAITQPNVAVTLLEATGKKAKFLQQVAQELGLKNVRVVSDRAETAGQDKKYRQQFDLAIARAVGPLNVMLEYTLPLVKVGGRVLAMKGSKAEGELEEAGDAIMTLGGGEVHVYDALPGVVDDAVIVEIHKAQPTPKQYPRLPGMPKMEPL